ncbi:MAG: hypothetical protein WCY89_05635 [Flavobacteriaceae bacterium]
MDLTIRKYRFIEKFMKFVNNDNIKLFEEFLSEKAKTEEIVAYTVQGQPLTKEQYSKEIRQADASIDSGQYTTVEDLEKEVKNW